MLCHDDKLGNVYAAELSHLTAECRCSYAVEDVDVEVFDGPDSLILAAVMVPRC